jgi:DNA polymerase III subunit delta
MLYILHGQDDYSVTRELAVIKQACGDVSLLVTNTVTLDGGQTTPTELRVACETVPFLSDKRLVVVNGLFERFTPTKQSRAAIKKADPANQEPFAAVLNGVPPFTVVVLIEDDLKESNPLFKLIAKNANVKSFPFLKGESLRQWVANRIREDGGTASPAAVSLLTRLIGGNLWIMSSEITKLLTYADNNRIEEKDVKAVVSYVQEFSVFNMIDAIIDNNLQKAEIVLAQLLNAGESPSGLLALLSRQMRLIVRARDLKAQKLSDGEIRSRLGITQDFVIRKTLEQASCYTSARIRQVYQQLLDTDVAIKTGIYEPELALNILVAELCL